MRPKSQDGSLLPTSFSDSSYFLALGFSAVRVPGATAVVPHSFPKPPFTCPSVASLSPLYLGFLPSSHPSSFPIPCSEHGTCCRTHSLGHILLSPLPLHLPPLGLNCVPRPMSLLSVRSSWATLMSAQTLILFLKIHLPSVCFL